MANFFSPAKINLFLKVISKRADGYHDLSTLMQTLSFGDNIEVEAAETDHFKCSDPSLSTDQTNLVMKALYLFRKKTGFSQKFYIHLEKRIPLQAGLGGGSSNAATILWACNQLTGKTVLVDDLQKWSSEIGSDIPFFFSHGSAHCSGRGEIVRNLPELSSEDLWIVKPTAGLSTAAVFQKLSFEMRNHLSSQSFESCVPYPFFNDLEAPAFAIEPQLKELKEHLLKSGFKRVLMTGAGSSFFCLGEGRMPQDLNATVYPAAYLNRTASDWYTAA